jgi:hypothetical protein
MHCLIGRHDTEENAKGACPPRDSDNGISATNITPSLQHTVLWHLRVQFFSERVVGAGAVLSSRLQQSSAIW